LLSFNATLSRREFGHKPQDPLDGDDLGVTPNPTPLWIKEKFGSFPRTSF
jgi:hypothetical protein